MPKNQDQYENVNDDRDEFVQSGQNQDPDLEEEKDPYDELVTEVRKAIRAVRFGDTLSTINILEAAIEKKPQPGDDEFQEYPKYIRHEDGREAIARDEDHEDQIHRGWNNNPEPDLDHDQMNEAGSAPEKGATPDKSGAKEVDTLPLSTSKPGLDSKPSVMPKPNLSVTKPDDKKSGV